MSVTSLPLTTSALLEGLFDLQNQAAWRMLDERFRPVLIACACKLGLEPVDAADVAQETLIQFARDYREGKYDRTRGRLRSWILGIARHRIAELQRGNARRRVQRGQSAMSSLPDVGDLERLWDEECRQAALCSALRDLGSTGKVSPRTLAAFRMHVIDGQTPEQVAKSLGTTVRAIYLAKHRCLARLRELMDGMREVFDLA